MALTLEPLLPSPPKKTGLPCKVLLNILSVATVICFTAFVTIHLNASTQQSNPFQPADLCTQSPNPTSCNTIVADAVLAAGNLWPRPVQVFRTILHKSLQQLDTASAAAAERKEQPGLADCIQLMDLSHDRILSSASVVAEGVHADARTWMSAVLTNHGTCLEGLDGEAKWALEPPLQALKALASTSLAVLNAISHSSDVDDVGKPVVRFPSWVSHHDRKLLEASTANGIKVDVVVAKDGSGKYKTVQEAVNSAPGKSTGRYVIYVRKGVYKENVEIGKKKINVMVVGDGMDATTITGSLNVVDGATTFSSATLAAVGDGLILQDLKIENTAGPQKHQAVALRVGADRSVINRCRLDGYQDTLYAHSLRQFYRDSTISGTVDFIFGNAAVVFQNSKLIARKPMDKQQNLVTAQGREDPNQNTGTSIQNCQVVPAPDLAPVRGSFPSYLGRPWKEYSRTVFMQSYIDSHIHPKGWSEWNGGFALKTLFYGEYQNRGPGAGTGGRVKWPGYHVITDPKVAKNFTVAELIQGGSWLKETGVAFREGL